MTTRERASSPDHDGAAGDPLSQAERLVDVVRALLAALPHQPGSLRVQADQVSVELGWPAATVVLPGAPPDTGQALVGAGAPPAVTVQAVSVTSNGHALVGSLAPDPVSYICAGSVGTFFRAPEPGAHAFVDEGDVVRPGQQVAIVEAMKLMLPVEADQAGRVRRVCLPDGAAVEYGDRLFELVPVQGD